MREETLNAGPSGIGGWLIVPAIGVIVSPLNLLRLLDFTATFQIIRRGTPFYAPLLADYLSGIGLAFFGLVVAIFFFRRRKIVPTLYIAFLSAGVAYGVFNGLILNSLTAGQDPAVFVPAGAGAIFAAIWISYFLRSRRVLNTFTR